MDAIRAYPQGTSVWLNSGAVMGSPLRHAMMRPWLRRRFFRALPSHVGRKNVRGFEMNEVHLRELWPGPAGRIELLFDMPHEAPRAIAIIAHPHPLLGGSAEHKVPAILARRLRDAGWVAVRPNFRGVGGTDGMHDDGVSEVDDLIAVSSRLRSDYGDLPLALIGFSFGAYVQIQVARRLSETGTPAEKLVLVGPGVGEVEGSRVYEPGDVPADTLVIHGEKDERVPLGTVLRWAEPQALPVVVVPGADHFFSRRLPGLARLVCSQLASVVRRT